MDTLPITLLNTAFSRVCFRPPSSHSVAVPSSLCCPFDQPPRQKHWGSLGSELSCPTHHCRHVVPQRQLLTPLALQSPDSMRSVLAITAEWRVIPHIGSAEELRHGGDRKPFRKLLKPPSLNPTRRYHRLPPFRSCAAICAHCLPWSFSHAPAHPQPEACSPNPAH